MPACLLPLHACEPANRAAAAAAHTVVAEGALGDAVEWGVLGDAPILPAAARSIKSDVAAMDAGCAAYDAARTRGDQRGVLRGLMLPGGQVLYAAPGSSGSSSSSGGAAATEESAFGAKPKAPRPPSPPPESCPYKGRPSKRSKVGSLRLPTYVYRFGAKLPSGEVIWFYAGGCLCVLVRAAPRACLCVPYNSCPII
jgi:hypothetical protein